MIVLVSSLSLREGFLLCSAITRGNSSRFSVAYSFHVSYTMKTLFAANQLTHTMPPANNPQSSTKVRITPSQIWDWLFNWPSLPMFTAIANEPTLSLPQKRLATQEALEECFANLQGAVVRYQSKLFQIVSKIEVQLPSKKPNDSPYVHNDLKLSFQLRRNNRLRSISGQNTTDAKQYSQFEKISSFEVDPLQLTHPFWTAHRFTLYGATIPYHVWQTHYALPPELQRKLVETTAEEFTSAGSWTEAAAKTWLQNAPLVWLSATPAHFTKVLLAPCGGHRIAAEASSCSLEPITTEDAVLKLLRGLAWKWTCALHAVYQTEHRPGSVWIKQRSPAYWAFELFTFQALRHVLDIDLYVQSEALEELLSYAEPSPSLTNSPYKSQQDHPSRVILPFADRPLRFYSSELRNAVKTLQFEPCTTVRTSRTAAPSYPWSLPTEPTPVLLLYYSIFPQWKLACKTYGGIPKSRAGRQP